MLNSLNNNTPIPVAVFRIHIVFDIMDLLRSFRSDPGRGTSVHYASFAPNSRVRSFSTPSWITPLLSLLGLIPKTRFIPTWDLLPPKDSKTTQNYVPILLDLCNETKKRGVGVVKMLQKDIIQEIADFTLFSLHDSPNLEPDEMNALHTLLDIFATLEVKARNVSLRGIEIGRSSSAGTREGTRLCVKVVKANFRKFLEAYSPEVVRRAQLVHRNILPFYGIYTFKVGSACMISPWTEWNLQQYVECHYGPQIRTPLVFDIIGGLKYLHDYDIVHGNLTCDNVLVSRDGTAMLTDFGSFVDAVAGWRTKSSERWTAPEVLHNGKQTKMSDIWSFGCLIYYIISGRLPYWNCLDPQVRATILAKELPYGPGHHRDSALAPLMEACWNTNPEKRPKSWSDIHDQVARSVERENDSKEMVNGSAKQMKEFWNEARSNVRVSFNFEQVHKNLATLLGPSHENECFSLIWAFAGRRELRDHYKNLRKEDARVIVDYLEEVLRKRQDARENWKLVMLLSRLIAETGCFPRAYQLADIVHDKAPVDKGGFATVYKGQWTHGPVCLKVSHHAITSEGLPPHLDKFRKIYIKELVTWAHLSHSNVLPFYGVFSVNHTPSPVLPWMENGNLSNYLIKNTKSPRLHLIMDIVSGLAYLHRINVIHGDLKTQNVLVSSEGRAVLADFGLVNTTTATAAGFTNPGDAFSNRWTAPEMLVGLEHNGPLPKPSKSGDIWSLSCLMYEILSRRPPYYQLLQISQVVAALQRQIIPKRPDGKEAAPIRDEIWRLMTECWNFNSDVRPTCQQILRQLLNLCPDYKPIKEKTQEIRIAEETRTNSSPVIDFYQTRNVLRRLAAWVPDVP